MRSVLVVLTLLSAGSASATTITFEELPSGFGYTYAESGGFSFTPSGYFAVDQLGDKFLSMYSTTTLTIDSLSGENFAVSSLQLFKYATYSVTLTGYLSGGGTIQQELASGFNFGTVFLDSSWNNLESLQISKLNATAPVGIDDIVISTVPVPAAVWLFGSALAGLGWLRRKQMT